MLATLEICLRLTITAVCPISSWYWFQTDSNSRVYQYIKTRSLTRILNPVTTGTLYSNSRGVFYPDSPETCSSVRGRGGGERGGWGVRQLVRFRVTKFPFTNTINNHTQEADSITVFKMSANLVTSDGRSNSINSADFYRLAYLLALCACQLD